MKTKIAFWLWQKFRFKEPENKFQKISTLGSGIRSLLIILPRDSKHLPLAQHFLKSLESRGQFSAINKIIGWEEQKDVLDQQLLRRVQLISENNINKYGLLSDKTIKQLTNGQFKCVINLDPIFNPVSYQLVSWFSSITRIGFNSDFERNIYNIIIDSNSGTNYIEQGYEYILEVLGL
ncbi:MAG: hypothetical protein GWP19_15555 [Planctomycetia bacterium]|nr:hypothetical protein [Planctomycetia bacterium]